MNKLLVIGDTHCQIHVLEQILKKENSDGTVSAILHCGDLGVYDEQSSLRITHREKSLLEKHNNPIHEFFPYVRGVCKFPVPIFMIPGNHEDFDLVDLLAHGYNPISDFTILGPSNFLKIHCGKTVFTVMGIGGILPGNIKASNRHRKRKSIPDTYNCLSQAKRLSKN